MPRLTLLVLILVLLTAFTACSKKSDPVVDGVKSSILALHKVYDAEIEKNGDASELTVADALDEAKVGFVMQSYWDFEVLGFPPKRYIATSSSTNRLGEGKTIWYDVDDEVFHGFRIDDDE
ncbi:MAG: hypothetical protein P9L91_06705 [Candidatus Zophobacter franzmannii]|jgi:hypothetical protein|nr:hypothetical protein [Candidatus Zophobacter franzmannii]